MLKTYRTVALALGFAALPALALANVAVGDALGTTDEEIRANLEAAGYAVEEIEREDGEIEVEALLNGEEVEIAVAADTGLVTGLEFDDEDPNDDNDD